MMTATQKENWPKLAGVVVHQDVTMPPEPEFTFTLSDASSIEGSPPSPPKNGFGSSQEEISLSPPKTILPSSQAESPKSPRLINVNAPSQEGCPVSLPKAGLASSEEVSLESPQITDIAASLEGSGPPTPRISGVASAQAGSIPSLPETVAVEFPVVAGTPPPDVKDGSAESQTFPVTDHHETEIAKECFVVPEPKDFRLHQEGCNYYLWNVVHRQSLLNMDSVNERLFQTFCKIKGKTYGWDHADKIKQSIKGNQAIRKYLAGSKSTYESFQLKMKAWCRCSQAGNSQSNNSPCIANALPAFGAKQDEQVLNDHSENVLDSDLRISESESEEDMDTN